MVPQTIFTCEENRREWRQSLTPELLSGFKEYMLTALLRAMSGRTLGDAAALGRRVWTERYAPLVAIAELPAPPLSPPLDCAAAPPDDERAEYARAAAASAARLPEATRGVWVGNLAEALAAEAVGAANVAAYFRALDACEAPRDAGYRDEL